MSTRIALATMHTARGHDEDEPLLLSAAARAGVHVDVLDWDDPAVDWSAYSRVLIRSTWDYTQRIDEFLPWLAHTSAVSELVNPEPMVRWNTDKHYLGDLRDSGIPVLATQFVEPLQEFTLPDTAVVVKPAIGAGSRGVFVCRTAPEAVEHVRRLHSRDATALVQPLLETIATQGEWPMVFFGGVYSHSANKKVTIPFAGADTGSPTTETTPHVATSDQIDVATAALDVVTRRFGTPAYARVDLVRDSSGECAVLEIELTEPSLFLPLADPSAADRYIEAVVAPSSRSHLGAQQDL